MAAILYRLIAPNDKCYIGVTTRAFEVRMGAHAQAKTVIGAALRKHGKDKFKKEILVLGPKQYIYNLEKMVIEYFNTSVLNGYNVAKGGEGGGRGYHTIESRQKIAKSHLGLRPSLMVRQKMAKARKGKTHSAQTLQKMSEAHKRRYNDMTKEERQKKFGHTYTIEERKEMSEKIKKTWADGGSRRCLR